MKLNRKPGFTLVELLVVIGIIGLLISILLPTLNRARAEAKRVQCLSNLRTLGQCYYEYVLESKGRGLFGLLSNLAPPPGASFHTKYWFASSTIYPTGYQWDVQQGYLSKYFKNPQFLSCPSASEHFKSFSSTTAAFKDSPLTTYAFNGNLTLAAPLGITSSSRIKNASETVALIDGATLQTDTTGTLTGILQSISPYVTSYGATNNKYPTFHGRHAGKGAVLWYDGHATTEAPYITTLASNLSTAFATPAGIETVRRMKIGYLTPSNAPEALLFQDIGTEKNNLSYYYWADKTTRQ